MIEYIRRPGAPWGVSHKLDAAMHHQALGAGAVEVLSTDASMEEVINAVNRGNCITLASVGELIDSYVTTRY